MVFDYRADGRCCTKMLSQPNLRSCSLRLRRAEGGGRAGGRAEDKREKEQGREEREKKKKKNKSKQARKDTKEATPKMSIKARRVKSSQGRTKGRQGTEEQAGVVESTGGHDEEKGNLSKHVLMFVLNDSAASKKCSLCLLTIFICMCIQYTVYI